MLSKTATQTQASISANDDNEGCPHYITKLKQTQVAEHYVEYNPII